MQTSPSRILLNSFFQAGRLLEWYPQLSGGALDIVWQLPPTKSELSESNSSVNNIRSN